MKPVCLRLGFVNKKSALAVALARKTRFGGRMWPPKTVPPKILEKLKLKKKKKIEACIRYPVFPIVTPCYPVYSPLAGWLAGSLARSLAPLPPEYPESHDFWLVLAGCHG